MIRTPAALFAAFFLILSFLGNFGCASDPYARLRVSVLPSAEPALPPVEPTVLRIPMIITLPSPKKLAADVSRSVRKELKTVESALQGTPAPTPRGSQPDPTAVAAPSPDTPRDWFKELLRFFSYARPRAGEVWFQMQQPIYLDKGVWFLFRPQSLSAGKTHLNPGPPARLVTILEMAARPVLVFQEERPSVTVKALPPLTVYKPGPRGFHAQSNVRVTYDEASRLLTDLRMGIVGYVFPESGGRKLTITRVRFYGSGGKVIAEVGLRYEPFPFNLSNRPARMTVYLRGTPRYLPKKQMLDLPDLDFDIKTGDFLVQAAAWIFDSDLKKELRRKARIPIGPKLNELSGKLQLALNRRLDPHTELSTRIYSLKVTEVFADNEGLVARATVQGDSSVNVDWN